jgi:hypothetical protein|eukprot:5078420-Prymnesium_polylepis.2
MQTDEMRSSPANRKRPQVELEETCGAREDVIDLHVHQVTNERRQHILWGARRWSSAVHSSAGTEFQDRGSRAHGQPRNIEAKCANDPARELSHTASRHTNQSGRRTKVVSLQLWEQRMSSLLADGLSPASSHCLDDMWHRNTMHPGHQKRLRHVPGEVEFERSYNEQRRHERQRKEEEEKEEPGRRTEGSTNA